MSADTQTTTLIEIRDFLHQTGYAPPPWSAPERAVDALYSMLRAHRGDDEFWRELSALVERLQDREFNRDALGDREVLREATVSLLVEELRRELGDGRDIDVSSLRRWLTSTVSASALVAFLLLGAATGCNEESTNVPNDPCDEAVAVGLEGDDADVYCELVQILDEANVDETTRDVMFDCLPELEMAYRAELLTQFQTLSGEELAARLGQMTDYGEVCGEEDAH